MNIILFAILIFFLLTAAELIAEKVKNTNYHHLNDAITRLSIAGFRRIMGVMKNLAPFTVYHNSRQSNIEQRPKL